MILDLGLPDGAGIDNIKRIQAVRADVPIVVLTGWDEAFSGKLVAAGAARFFNKGRISEGGLLGSIEQAVASYGSQPEVSPPRVGPAPASSENARLEALELAARIRLRCSDLLLGDLASEQATAVREIAALAKDVYEKLE